MKFWRISRLCPKRQIIVSWCIWKLLKFRNLCLENNEFDPAKFLLTPGSEWQPALKKTKVKLDFLTSIDMLLMVEKRNM